MKKRRVVCLVVFFAILFNCTVAAYGEESIPIKKEISSAASFPGKVSKTAARIKNKAVKINLTVEDYAYLKMWYTPENWQSTGLYAAPGETVTIEVPKGIKYLDAQIGCHTDKLEQIPAAQRLRASDIVVKKHLKAGSNSISNPYGGLIYIIPVKSQSKTETTVKISNAVKAPYFVLGKMSDAQWKKVRNNPTPFAELEGSRVILTIPSGYIRDLDNPTELMEKWDELVAREEAITGLSPDNPLPDKSPKGKWRYVCDIQLSYGLMYCGYPIMLYDDGDKKALVSVDGLTHNGWGFWHELGHNYQQYNWELNSLVEVTNNIFSLNMEKYFGNSCRLLEDNDGTGHSSFEDALAYVKGDSPDKNFNDDKQTTYFTRLVMFWQLQKAYGDDFYPRLFTAFRELNAESDARTDQEKIDQIVVMTSKISGSNLLEFYKNWGFRYSDKAKEQVENMKLPGTAEKIWLYTL